jgi:polar amino acid transport system substrate-binding protein
MLLRRTLLCLPALAGSARGLAAGGGERPLLLVNAVYPPFVNPPGHAQGEGLDIDIAREALRRAGRQVEVQLLPWKRALLMLERGQADLTTTISRNSERDRFLRFTQSYRNGASYQFYTRRGTALALRSLDDLAGRRLGTVEGFFYPEAITGRPDVVVDTARDVGLLAQKLQAGRIDVMVVTGIRGAWEIREAGLQDVLTRQPYAYTTASPNYIAFSRARSDAALVTATREALQQMMADGSVAAIERHYLQGLQP